MYSLDTNTDLSELESCTLTFVGFGEHQLALSFSGITDCSITVEGDYSVSAQANRPVTYTNATEGAADLLRLLGRDVVSATVPEAGTIRIAFDDESVVDIRDSDTHYESYQVNLGTRTIIV